MTPRSYIFMPALLLSFLTAESQKIKKEDKVTLANLQSHVQSLAADTAGGRSMGMPGEKTTGDYVISVLSQAGVKPRGDRNGWLQAFTIDEGRRLGPDAIFTIDDQPLVFSREWFPLAICPAGQVKGSPAIALQESGVPWFVDLKEILEGGAATHAGQVEAIRAKAASCAKKGATALILFNSSSHRTDRLEFDPKDRPTPAAIPVLYLTREAKKKYLPDESASVDLTIRISYTEQEESGNNVVAMLDNGAPTTAVIASRYDNASGTAAMLELARMLAAAKSHSHNYLFVVCSGNGAFRPGASWFAGHPPVDAKKISYAIVLNGLGELNDTTHALAVGGYGPAWAPVWNAIMHGKEEKGDKHPLSFRYDSSATAPGDQAVFSHQHIPTLVFSTGPGTGSGAESGGEPVNFEGELQVVKFIYALIERAP